MSFSRNAIRGSAIVDKGENEITRKRWRYHVAWASRIIVWWLISGLAPSNPRESDLRFKRVCTTHNLICTYNRTFDEFINYSFLSFSQEKKEKKIKDIYNRSLKWSNSFKRYVSDMKLPAVPSWSRFNSTFPSSQFHQFPDDNFPSELWSIDSTFRSQLRIRWSRVFFIDPGLGHTNEGRGRRGESWGKYRKRTGEKRSRG